MISENTSTDSANSKFKKRGLIAVLTVLFLIVVIVIGNVMREHEPNFYAPGRTHLVNAKIKLEKTLALEETYIKERRQAHREIETAITNLASVAEVDTQDRKLISALLQQLKEIERLDMGTLPDGDMLQNKYKSVMQQIDELIEKLEKSHP
jgi:hypothetical protein